MQIKTNQKKFKKEGKAILFIGKLFMLLIAFTFSLLTANAQETNPIAGGDASGSGGSASYTIGQTFYLTNTGTNGSVAEGVQQPYEISVVIGIKEAEGITLNCSAYPNPATDYLLLKVESENLKDLSYQLFDVNSKLIESKKIVSNETSIVMSNLVTATYFVKVIQGNKEIKAYKIVKN